MLPDYNPKNILKVKIDEVIPNDYNPKGKDTKEYKNVVKSLVENGLQQPIMVREQDGQYIIVDGEQRYTAAKELGFEDIYIYNFGEISEDQAQSLTIWMEVQVPFDEIELAPLVVKLNDIGFEMPYTEAQIIDFKNLSEFDFESAYKDTGAEVEYGEQKEKPLHLKTTLSKEQHDEIVAEIEKIVKAENVGEGQALLMLVQMGAEQYDAQNYIPETDLE